MKYIDRNGNTTIEDSAQDRFLRMLYTHPTGRMLLRPFISPWFSNICGKLLSSRLSSGFISGFVKRNEIDLSICLPKVYSSYNDFFTRKMFPKYRPIAENADTLISPCDGKISVYSIHDNCTLFIKNTLYTLEQLLTSQKLAAHYAGGYAMVIRLTVDDYHRYCYAASGMKSEQYRVPGVFHAVNPIANDTLPIYKMNTREFCLIKTEKMGTILAMEVGALLVGKIHNDNLFAGPVKRGEEKGRFEFGGSTIVLLVQKDSVSIDSDLLRNTRNGYETYVKYGEQIGTLR